MINTISTATSLCSKSDQLTPSPNDILLQSELAPFNTNFIDEKFLQKLNPLSLTSPQILTDLHLPLASCDQQQHLRLKHLFRTTTLHLSHLKRSSLWYNLITSSVDKPARSRNSVEHYKEDVRNMFGRDNQINVNFPSFVDNKYDQYYHLNQNGRDAVKHILSVFAYHKPDITLSPLLYSITSLLLHYMTEIHVYEVLYILTSSENFKFITQTEIQWNSLCQLFKQMLRKHSKSTHELIIKHGHSHLFDNWLLFIYKLPFLYAVHIFDCLLIEGIKVWIRIGLALFDLFLKCNINNNNGNQEQPQPNNRKRKSSLRQTFHRQVNKQRPKSIGNDYYELFNQFIRNINIPADKLFKYAFSIRNLKRKDILRILDTEEQRLRAERKKVSTRANGYGGQQDDGISNNPSLESLRTAINSATSIKRSESHLQQANSIMFSSHTRSLPIMIREIDTSILSHAQIAFLWSLLPKRLSVFQPELVYTSRIHGHRLLTLYDHVEYYEHCIIIIKNQLMEIFGAFCSGSWAQRYQHRNQYFGNGETFLFTFVPQNYVYKWVGLEHRAKLTEEYFLCGDNERLMIGGSSNPLNIGLSIDQDLFTGSTKQCDTFLNQPLSSLEKFEILDIEVIGFK